MKTPEENELIHPTIEFKCSCNTEWSLNEDLGDIKNLSPEEGLFNKKHECSNLIVYQAKKSLIRIYNRK